MLPYIKVSAPPKLNPFVCEEDSDVESMSSEDSDDESEATSDSSSDKSYMDDESSSTSDSYGSSAMDVDGPDDEDELTILTARNASQWCHKWLSTADSQNLIMTRWCDALRDYHFCAQPPKVSVIQV